ncbi:MAG: tetratricopeptide repeat protein, partial [Acidobacteriota bacterium]
ASLIVLLALVSAVPARSQVLVAPGESNETAFRKLVRGQWFGWLAALEEGDSPLARSKVDEILKYAQKIEIRRMTDLALSATLLGRRELAAGKREIAREAFSAAIRLDPDLPEPRWARLSLSASTRAWGDLVPDFFGAVRATFADAESRRVVLVRLLLVFLLTACAAALAAIFVLLVRHGPRLVHDLRESADGVLRGRATGVAVAAFLVAPLLLSLDVLWLALFLFVLLFGYASLTQKIATSLALALSMLLLPVADRIAYDLSITSSPILRAAEALHESRYDQRVLDNLEAAKNIVSDDVDIRFVLGRLYQALGQNDRAISEYTEGSRIAPNDIRCLVNRGNIRFVDGDLGSAQEDYQEALKRDPRSIVARYNLALLYAETFRTQEAAQTLQEARALDARAVQGFQETPTLVKVVSIGFTPEEARQKIERMEHDGRTRRLLGHYRSYRLGDGLGLPRFTGSPFSIDIGMPLFWAILVAIGAAIFLDRARRQGRGYASECQKCGRAFCRLCKPPGESALLCSQCVHVYLKKDGVAIETKLQKLADVRRRRSLEEKVQLVLNGLLPGSTAFLDSRLPAAVIAFGLFAFGLLAVLLRDALATLPRPTLSAGTPGIVFWLAVALAGWIVGFVTSTRKA